MNFQQTLICALASDYWSLSRMLDRNHNHHLKVGNSLAPIFELLFKQNDLSYKTHQIGDSHCELVLEGADDFDNFEYFLLSIKNSREHHLIQEPETENTDKVRDYLHQIEAFFSPNSKYRIGIPLGVLDIPGYPKKTYFYMICNLKAQTALFGDLNDLNVD